MFLSLLMVLIVSSQRLYPPDAVACNNDNMDMRNHDPKFAFLSCSSRSSRQTTSYNSYHRRVQERTRKRLPRRRRSWHIVSLNMIAERHGDSGELGRSNSGPEEARSRRRHLVPGTRRSLLNLAESVNKAVLEMCVENEGRPLAAAMTDLVERGVEAFVSDYSLEALLLELQLLDDDDPVPGKTLTGVEKRYRTQWLHALHLVLQNLGFVEQRQVTTPEEFHLKSQVEVVLKGRLTNDEQTFVKFDKALATGGVSGGAATEHGIQLLSIGRWKPMGRRLQDAEAVAAGDHYSFCVASVFYDLSLFIVLPTNGYLFHRSWYQSHSSSSWGYERYKSWRRNKIFEFGVTV